MNEIERWSIERLRKSLVRDAHPEGAGLLPSTTTTTASGMKSVLAPLARTLSYLNGRRKRRARYAGAR
ncbi:MAG TPA: hypothetical protein VGX92_11580 [Pyrinomonadaceae bacterium]|nr:hypothetical protein [Pyrinomonadaceae bacterium]